jgi:hypothetical protein
MSREREKAREGGREGRGGQTFGFDLVDGLLGGGGRRARVAVRVVVPIEVVIEFGVGEGPGLHVLESFIEALRSARFETCGEAGRSEKSQGRRRRRSRTHWRQHGPIPE